MKIGYKSKHTKWIYNVKTKEMRCLGAIGCYSRWDCIPEEFLWCETDGTYIILLREPPCWQNLWGFLSCK